MNLKSAIFRLRQTEMNGPVKQFSVETENSDIFRLDGHMNLKSAIFRLRQTEMNGPVKLFSV